MKKKTLIIGITLILVLICGVTIYIVNKKYQLKGEEVTAYTQLRLAIAQSNNAKIGEISSKDLNNLKNAVKKFKNNAAWFSDYYGSFYGISKDTSKHRIDYLCDEDYCAKFTIEYTAHYYLVDYSFEPITNDNKGNYITINRE